MKRHDHRQQIDGADLRAHLIRRGVIRPDQGDEWTAPPPPEPVALPLDDEGRKAAAATIRDPARYGEERWRYERNKETSQ